MPRNESGGLNEYSTLRHEAKPSEAKCTYKSVMPLSLLVSKATFYNEHYKRCLLFSSRTKKTLCRGQKKVDGSIFICVANKCRK